MKQWLLLLLTPLILVGCAAPDQNTAYRQVRAEEAIELMETEENYLILDVRTLEEFRAQHIPGAVCIPNEVIEAQAPAELPDTDQLIFVYCRSGNRSRQAAQKLAGLGYTNIIEFGGILDWPGETVAWD